MVRAPLMRNFQRVCACVWFWSFHILTLAPACNLKSEEENIMVYAPLAIRQQKKMYRKSEVGRSPKIDIGEGISAKLNYFPIETNCGRKMGSRIWMVAWVQIRGAPSGQNRIGSIINEPKIGSFWTVNYRHFCDKC